MKCSQKVAIRSSSLSAALSPPPSSLGGGGANPLRFSSPPPSPTPCVLPLKLHLKTRGKFLFNETTTGASVGGDGAPSIGGRWRWWVDLSAGGSRWVNLLEMFSASSRHPRASGRIPKNPKNSERISMNRCKSQGISKNPRYQYESMEIPKNSKESERISKNPRQSQRININ